jgi:hypothetical protein
VGAALLDAMWSKYPATPRGSVKGEMMDEDESVVSLGNGTYISLSGTPVGQKESDGSFVMVCTGISEPFVSFYTTTIRRPKGAGRPINVARVVTCCSFVCVGQPSMSRRLARVAGERRLGRIC